MITGEEIGRSLRGVGRFALLDRSGIQAFDGSPGAFWRSFFAAVIIAPPYFYMAVATTVADSSQQVSLLRLFSAEVVGYVLIWTAFPLAMVYLCRAIGRDSQYFTFMTAYNWAQVLEMAAWLLGAYLIDAAPPDLAAPIYWGLLALLLGYEWFIARVTLDLPGLAAAGPVALSSCLTLTIGYLMSGAS